MRTYIIDQKYLPSVRQFCRSNGIDHLENPDGLSLSTAPYIENRKRYYFDLLMHEYHRRESKIPLAQFLDRYANQLKQYAHTRESYSLNRALEKNQYQQAKIKLVDYTQGQKQEQILGKIKCLQQLKEKHDLIVEEEADTYQKLITNLEYQVEELEQQRREKMKKESSQETVRVKKAIQNGMWGYRDKIEEKILKLNRLQAEFANKHQCQTIHEKKNGQKLITQK